jgi:hypothetical protein
MRAYRFERDQGISTAVSNEKEESRAESEPLIFIFRSLITTFQIVYTEGDVKAEGGSSQLSKNAEAEEMAGQGNFDGFSRRKSAI